MPVIIGRRELIGALVSAAAWPLAARAQQPGEGVRRVDGCPHSPTRAGVIREMEATS